MLIKCPECKKEVSDKSKVCIHCGYPFQESNISSICKINGIGYDLSQILNDINLDVSCSRIIRTISDTCNISLSSAMELYKILLNEKEIPSSFNCEMKQLLNDVKPKCPTCSSTNLKKISTCSKVMNTAMWGILGTKRYKTYHCNNCGYEW